MKYTDWCIPELRQLEARRAAIKSMSRRILLLESQYGALRGISYDGDPVQGGEENKAEAALLANIAERQELGRKLKQTRELVSLTEDALAGLTETDRVVLDHFFINRKKGHVETLEEELHVERTQVYRLRNSALIEFARRLYGVVEV